MGRVDRLLVFLVGCLVVLSLAGCGSDNEDPLSWLTPGATPSAMPGVGVWAVGIPDVVLGSADGGASWNLAHRGEITDDSLGDLWSVAFGDTDHGWAVRRGRRNSPTAILATSDGGATWGWQHPVARGRLLAVAASGASRAWAAGYTGTKPLLLATSDGGTTWREQRILGRLGLYDIAFSDARHGWALAAGPPDNLGRQVVLATSDGGAHWRSVYRAADKEHLRRLACRGANRCWVVGWTDASGGQSQGYVLMSQDGGSSWHPQASLSAQPLVDVAFPDARHGWAVGAAGTILATADGGNSWVSQQLDGRLDLNAVAFSDAGHGWVLIGHSALLATADGGRTWRPVRPPQSQGLGLVDITSFAPNVDR